MVQTAVNTNSDGKMNQFINFQEVKAKLSPSKNPEIAWFCVFFPALVCYLFVLTQHINAKPFVGSLDIINANEFSKLGNSGENVELIVNSSIFASGPVWVENSDASLSYLLFSDLSRNRLYKWEEGKGLFTVGKTIQNFESGCKLNRTYCDTLVEPGSNGLLQLLPMHQVGGISVSSIDLLVCQQGERAISLFRENGTRSYVATHYKDRRLNSPAAMVWSPDGHLLFTDPPFGLQNHQRTPPQIELPFSGIYMILAEDLIESIATGLPTRSVKLLSREVPRPYGLGFTPDFSKLIVANAEMNNAHWKIFEVSDNGSLIGGKVFFNASEQFGVTDRGLPRGLVVDIHGRVIASGPGGVLVFSPQAELLARFRLPSAITGVSFAPDGKLYITGKNLVARIRLQSRPIRLAIAK